MKALLTFLCLFVCSTSLTQTVQDTSHLLFPNGAEDTALKRAQEASAPIARSHPGRVKLIAAVHGGGYAGTLLLLSEAWYKDFPRTKFHFFNDNKEWLQMDKAGHVWTAYNIAKYSKGLWTWAGVSPRKAVWLGGISSMGYQTILEYLDAHSAEWGWSWADIGGNFLGASLYVAQELSWKEQRLQLKLSSHRVSYAPDLKIRADGLYGASLPERILKDYNGQTYWLSINAKSFMGDRKVPTWLNAAVGYGATGVFGGFENKGYDREGRLTFDRSDIARQRQWYLAPDIDFTKIKTKKRGVKTVLSLLNMVKMPSPALELSKGKLKAHLLFF